MVDSPIAAGEFAAALQRFGPFEDAPVVAVAVSGGGDSLALLHLLHEWARSVGGRAVAMTVDHAIRPESSGELVTVAAWAARLGVEHVSLRWDCPEPGRGGLQTRARAARYRLLAAACAERGILHLATAHHADDQGETVLLRLARGSGPDGLAGIGTVSYQPELRLLRPLLGFPAARLKQTCRARGQEWLDDPSNTAPRFARARLRAARGVLEAEGLSTASLCSSALLAGRARAALERATAQALARSAVIHPQGYASLDRAAWEDDDPEIRRRVLASLLHAVGGQDYLPGAEALDRAMDALAGEETRLTLGACVVEADGAALLILRELRNLPPPVPATVGWTRWDRFCVRAPRQAEIGALGKDLPDDLPLPVSRLVAASQPALRQAGVLLAVPTLGFYRDTATCPATCEVRFSPPQAAGGSEFVI